MKITNRRKQILELVARGSTNKEIAELLCLSVDTVKRHIDMLMDGLTAFNRTQLAILAINYGYITVPDLRVNEDS